MNKEERQQLILDRVAEYKMVRVMALSSELGISDDTVRRDINELDAAGKLVKVHGGAMARSVLPREYDSRYGIEQETKRKLALKAVKLFSDDDVLLVDGGTTNLELMRIIPDDLNLTVYTNSLPIATEMADKKNIDLHLLGGKVFAWSRDTYGQETVEAVMNIIPDWLVLGVSNIHPEKGITNIDSDEAELKRVMLHQAEKVVAMVDNSKLNTVSPYVVGQIHDLDVLVVEDNSREVIEKDWLLGGVRAI